MKPHFELVAVGTPSVDVLYTESGIIRRFGGGAVITASMALAKWGMQTGIVGRVGKDAGGEWLLKNFREDGVDISLVKRDRIPTSVWTIDVAPGDREILEPRIYSPLARLSLAQKKAVEDSDAVIVRLNNPLFKETVHLAKKSGSKLFVTFHLFEFSPPTIDFLRRHEPDVIFMTREEYEEALQEFDLFSMDTLFVIMKGRDGCCGFYGMGKLLCCRFSIRIYERMAAEQDSEACEYSVCHSDHGIRRQAQSADARRDGKDSQLRRFLLGLCQFTQLPTHYF